MPADSFDRGLIQIATRMLDNSVNEGAGYDNLINVLSLMCLISILNRNQSAPQQSSIAAAPANPLQKLIGDLSKGDAGMPSADTLMSLLPLLNSPQLKSKINPGTIAAVMGLINNMGGIGGLIGDKQEAKVDKTEKTEKTEKAEKTERVEKQPVKQENPDNKNDLPAAAIVTSEIMNEKTEPTPEPTPDQERRHPGRYLNWKSSF